jgi:hypothetical protein
MPTAGPFWEERLVRPIDIYPEFRKEQHLAEYGRQVDDRSLEVTGYFLTFSALQSPIHTPYLEYLVKWNGVHQFWFEEPLKPQNGVIRLPEFARLYPRLDESRIEASAEL